MSSSRHPIALALERRVSSSTKLLAVVMCLPLIDGVFAAVVLAGSLSTITGILEVGLLLFGGSAMIAVILAEMDETPRQQARIVLGVGVVLILGAATQAALAPTIGSLLDMIVFERFAALVILSVAAATASARIGEMLPGSAAIVALGLIASVSPESATLTVQTDIGLILRAVAAAGAGIAFALAIALTSPWLRSNVDIDRFRFGSAVSLGVLALSVFGLIPGEAPVALAVLAVTALLAFNPDGSAPSETETAGTPSPTAPDGGTQSSQPVQTRPGVESTEPGLGPGSKPFQSDTADSTTASDQHSTDSDNDPTLGEDRPPWF